MPSLATEATYENDGRSSGGHFGRKIFRAAAATSLLKRMVTRRSVTREENLVIAFDLFATNPLLCCKLVASGHKTLVCGFCRGGLGMVLWVLFVKMHQNEPGLFLLLFFPLQNNPQWPMFTFCARGWLN